MITETGSDGFGQETATDQSCDQSQDDPDKIPSPSAILLARAVSTKANEENADDDLYPEGVKYGWTEAAY